MTFTRRMCAQIIAASVATTAVGCAGGRTTPPRESAYETVATPPTRDLEIARKEHARALALLDKQNLPEAEAALKRALAADVTFGPAHNTLGTVYYRGGNYYLAAWEYQYASKVMPSQPEPLNNLGLVFESTNRLDEAVAAYDRALALEADNPEYVGNAARARIRRGDSPAEVRPLLDKLLVIDSRPAWIEWAKQTRQKQDSADGPDEAGGADAR